MFVSHSGGDVDIPRVRHGEDGPFFIRLAYFRDWLHRVDREWSTVRFRIPSENAPVLRTPGSPHYTPSRDGDHAPYAMGLTPGLSLLQLIQYFCSNTNTETSNTNMERQEKHHLIFQSLSPNSHNGQILS